MKKNGLIVFFAIFAVVPVHAQDSFFTDSLRKELKQHLIDRNIASYPEQYFSGGLNILNMISMNLISEDPPTAEYKFGIYCFWGNMFPILSEILIRRGDEYEILEMVNGNSLMEIMTELIAYFDRHPEVNRYLFPLYVDAVSRVYFENSHWLGANGLDAKGDRTSVSKYGKLSNDSIYKFIEATKGEFSFDLE
jgi:hypothetical protein